MKTFMAKEEDQKKCWYVLDAQNEVLGRLASKAAVILRGKTKPEFTPHIDTGDFVIIINAAKVRMTGRKFQQKLYYHHSGYPGALKVVAARKMIKEKPEEVIRKAVRGMLPKNRLGRQLFRKLKVYAGADHPHQAQKPQLLRLS
ncbi:MAG: 50S ribosomal protein L13 [bacterium]|nr:50S ribosomal protein L13 [bacterium]